MLQYGNNMRHCLAACVLAVLPFGNIQIAQADSAVRLTTDDSASETDPAWSVDGSTIAYSYQMVENADIWMIPAAGGSATRVTTDALQDADPSWSPDGSMIVFRSNRKLPPAHGQNLWKKVVAGGAATQVTFSRDYDWNPAWSPDGSTICFARGLHTYERTLWVVSVMGGQEEQLVDGVAHTPAWSPDGSQIAFAAKSVGFWHLFVTAATGGSMQQITPNRPSSNYVDDPTWSPDGQHIAYLANSPASPEPQIWIIAATGGEPWQLTDGDGTDRTPDWSPDGSQIAFSSNRNGSADIWLIPVSTTAVQQANWSQMKEKYRE